MEHYAIRISRPYTDISGVITKASDLSEQSVWYEHPADEDVSRTHVHGLLLCSSIKTDTVKNWIKKELAVTEFSKYDWAFATSFKTKDKRDIKITKDNYERYVTYMTKGRFEPVFYKAFTKESIEDCKALWVDYKAPTVIHHGEATHEKTRRTTTFDMEEEVLNEYMFTYPEEFKNKIIKLQPLYKMVKDVLKRNRKGRYNLNITRMVESLVSEINEDAQYALMKNHFHYATKLYTANITVEE